MTGPLGFFLLAAAQANPAMPANPAQAPDGAALVSVFSRFCLSTLGDRAKFDVEVERANIRKTSHPFPYSGLEFKRRWDVEAVELAYLDAPSPPGRLCSVSAAVRGGYDGDRIVSAVSGAAGIPFRLTRQKDGFRTWKAADANGNVFIVNNDFGAFYFARTEIILRPAHQPAEEP